LINFVCVTEWEDADIWQAFEVTDIQAVLHSRFEPGNPGPDLGSKGRVCGGFDAWRIWLLVGFELAASTIEAEKNNTNVSSSPTRHWENSVNPLSRKSSLAIPALCIFVVIVDEHDC
jgi:hypothetical protein